MEEVIVGPDLVALIAWALDADVPVMVHGPHGVGKSEVIAAAADDLRVGHVVQDLSLLEPVDLLGMPRVQEGKTIYAPPDWLPSAGRGLLLFEELNRAPRHTLAPCLQLLTARRLGDYRLPTGWLPCAAGNDADDGYFVDELDKALLSRFLHVRVVPDVLAWAAWATKAAVHPAVVSYVSAVPDVFAASNPRAWVMVSKLVTAWEARRGARSLLTVGITGLVGDVLAAGFVASYLAEKKPLTAEDILARYPIRRVELRARAAAGDLDVVRASVELLKRHLQPTGCYRKEVRDPVRWANVTAFASDLPAELRRMLADWAAERNFPELVAACAT